MFRQYWETFIAEIELLHYPQHGLPSSSLFTVFDSISSNINEVPLINPSFVFVFGDFDIHRKDWLTYSGGTDGPDELCYNFSFWNDLTQMVDFPTWIPDWGSYSPALLDLFLASNTSVYSTMAFIPLGYSDHLLSQFPLTFRQTQNRTCFTAKLMTIFIPVRTAFMIIWEIFHGGIYPI